MTKHIRPHAAETYLGIKAATRLLVQACGGVEAFAACTRATRTLASDYAAPHVEDRWIPADVIADAEMIAGVPHVTAALARAAGCVLTPLPTEAAGVLAQKLALLGRDVGMLFGDAATALGHGTPTPPERARLAADLDEVARAALSARAALAAEEDVA